MKTVILATGNEHKKREFQDIFAGSMIIQSLKDISFTDPIAETGKTFIENALIKCQAVYNKTSNPVMADDSGLVVDALNGEPGIYSARYGGDGLSDEDRYQLLLQKMQGIQNRRASFICALVYMIDKERIYVVQEAVTGSIVDKADGAGGFGYDPVFYVEEFGRTMAGLSNDEKHSVSHRGRAARAMKRIIDSVDR